MLTLRSTTDDAPRVLHIYIRGSTPLNIRANVEDTLEPSRTLMATTNSVHRYLIFVRRLRRFSYDPTDELLRLLKRVGYSDRYLPRTSVKHWMIVYDTHHPSRPSPLGKYRSPLWTRPSVPVYTHILYSDSNGYEVLRDRRCRRCHVVFGDNGLLVQIGGRDDGRH